MSETGMREIDRESAFYTFKRCPYCYTHLKLAADHCVECRKKVGPVDKLGLARKPFNTKAYTAALLWIALIALYIWKGIDFWQAIQSFIWNYFKN